MRCFSRAALIVTTLGLVGCGGGSPPTIIPTPGTTRTEAQLKQVRTETERVADMERANLAGVRYFPPDEQAEKVEAEERANLATTPRL